MPERPADPGVDVVSYYDMEQALRTIFRIATKYMLVEGRRAFLRDVQRALAAQQGELRITVSGAFVEEFDLGRRIADELDAVIARRHPIRSRIRRLRRWLRIP